MRALIFNTTLKKNPEESHTKLLLNAVGNILAGEGVEVEHVHLLSHEVPPGVYPDMTEHGWARDDWPMLWEKVKAANILVVGTPLWLGEESSVCRVLIERLYAMSGELNDKGQSIYYGKVGGCVVTGNEDGIKHAAMTVGFALNHLGLTIPPQADCGWIGEAGPGPSYGDEMEDGSRAGFDNAFTRRNTTIMAWNLLHLARLLAGGIPNAGNDRRELGEGVEIDHDNPEYRS
ncbi:MAG: flavodoxin family protein [Vannielia sp.]|uniref:flavodoxin family protein n=1 Tax=Rhodobacterales TaxID=204455 RepID=UPI002094A615|nr:NAD(P)H-dependent oxidoreductase [Oceanicola sp. 502str15]MCO6381786.1 flavodoxin family protein [Oceanicola sp. 502str15]